MLRPPLSEAGNKAALFALPFVCLFVWLFNSYKLGRLNLKWYQDMSVQQQHRFKKVVIVCIICIVLVAVILGYLLYSVRPFETLDVDEIEEIKVYAIPPEKGIVLSEVEAKSVVPLLQNLKISKPGYKLFTFGMSGQTVNLTVQKIDDSTIEISNVGNVLIIIDGKSYQADYESAEAINQFANKVLGTGF